MNYYLEKILNLVRKSVIKSYDGVIYANSRHPLKDYDLILFYFNYPQLMHLGDQLYFKPLVVKLAKSGYPVAVIPTDNMRFFFRDYLTKKEEIVHKGNFKKTLIISRLELLPKITQQFGKIDYFLYDSMSPKINLPISNFIINSFSKYYQLGERLDLCITPNDYLDFSLVSDDRFGLLKKSGIIFFNNYVDSGKFRISKASKDRLIAKLIGEKNNNYVVHLGTKQDTLNDQRDYHGIVDLDLRGLTTPEDIFLLMTLPNIRAVYCYDTFILHVANILNHKINLIFKKYLFHNAQKRTAFASLFIKENNSNIVFL